MNIEIEIRSNQHWKPADKLEDAEIHVIGGELEGLKLVGFAIWQRREGSGRSVTFLMYAQAESDQGGSAETAPSCWSRPGAHSESGRAHRKLMNHEANKRVTSGCGRADTGSAERIGIGRSCIGRPN
jgi:hypothetical protein